MQNITVARNTGDLPEVTDTHPPLKTHLPLLNSLKNERFPAHSGTSTLLSLHFSGLSWRTAGDALASQLLLSDIFYVFDGAINFSPTVSLRTI